MSEAFTLDETGGSCAGWPSKGLVLVKVYTNECGHCRAMQPEWEKIVKSPPPGVAVGSVHASKLEGLSASMPHHPQAEKIASKLQGEMVGVPMIAVVSPDGTITEHSGPRTKEAIAETVASVLRQGQSGGGGCRSRRKRKSQRKSKSRGRGGKSRRGGRRRTRSKRKSRSTR